MSSITCSPFTALKVAFAALFLFVGDTANAQSGREDRRQFVDDLLRTLIDNKSDPDRVDRDRGIPSATATRVRPGTDIRDVQTNLTRFSQELSNLVSQLHSDVNRTPGVRSYLGDSLKVNAAVTLLARRANTARSVTELSREYEQIDRDWRLLAFRLDQIRDLSSRARTTLDRCNTINDQIGQLMDVKPQLNQTELFGAVSTLTNSLHNLLEDIDTDVDDPNLRYNLMSEGRQVYAQGQALSRGVSPNGSYGNVRTDYEEFRRLWNPFANHVRELNYPYVARQLRRVQNADRSVQELLWLDTGIDRSEISYLAQSLRSDTNDLMDSITLKQLASLDGNRDGLVDYASTFYTTCSDFADLVRNGDEKDTLTEVYYYLKDDWKRFGDSIRGIDTRAARQKYREIDKSVDELRDILGVRPPLDRQRGIETAGQLENLASYYDRNIRQTLATGGRFSRDFQEKTVRASSNFLKASRSIHANLAREQNLRTLRELSDQLSKDWETLISYTTRIPDSVSGNLEPVRRRMTPLLVDLQAMLAP